MKHRSSLGNEKKCLGFGATNYPRIITLFSGAQGSNSSIFVPPPQSQLRSTLKGKNLLLEEQILSLKSRPHRGRASLSRETNRKS